MAKKKWGKIGFHNRGQYYFVRKWGKPISLTGKGGTFEEAEVALAKLIVEDAEPNNNDGGIDNTAIKQIVILHLRDKMHVDKNKVFKDRERTLQAFVKMFGDSTPNTLHAADIDTFVRSLPAPRGGGGKYQAFACVRHLFNWCIQKRGGSKNPCVGADKPKRNVRCEDYVFSSGEYSQIRHELVGQYLSLLDVLWETGARMSSIIIAKVGEYDAQERCLHKKSTDRGTKNKKIDIPLTSKARGIIEAAIQGRTEGYIFQGEDGQHLCLDTLCKSIKRAAKKIGRNKPTCSYSLRHSFAVRHLERGVPIHVVAAWMGNTVPVLEKHYGHTLARLKNYHRWLEDETPSEAS